MKKEIEIDLNSPNATSNGAMEKQVDALLIDGLNEALGTNRYSLRIPAQSCHRFHGKAATCSTGKLPPIPVNPATP